MEIPIELFRLLLLFSFRGDLFRTMSSEKTFVSPDSTLEMTKTFFLSLAKRKSVRGYDPIFRKSYRYPFQTAGRIVNGVEKILVMTLIYRSIFR